jgi:hypothetical protein
MIKHVYWGIRVFAYAASLCGIFMHLHGMQAIDSRAGAFGLPLVGIGFIAFFVSYAIRAWIRFAPNRDAPKS